MSRVDEDEASCSHSRRRERRRRREEPALTELMLIDSGSSTAAPIVDGGVAPAGLASVGCTAAPVIDASANKSARAKQISRSLYRSREYDMRARAAANFALAGVTDFAFGVRLVLPSVTSSVMLS